MSRSKLFSYALSLLLSILCIRGTLSYLFFSHPPKSLYECIDVATGSAYYRFYARIRRTPPLLAMGGSSTQRTIRHSTSLLKSIGDTNTGKGFYRSSRLLHLDPYFPLYGSKRNEQAKHRNTGKVDLKGQTR